MKKLLLSFLCVASSLAASAQTSSTQKSVVYFFDGTESTAYGMTRTSDTGDWNPDVITLTPPIAQETVILRGHEGHRLWSDGLRMYSGSSMEVIAPAGYVLTTIKIQTDNETQAQYLKLAAGGSGTYTTGKITIGTAGTTEFSGGTWTGSSSSVTLNNQSGRADIASLTVNYEVDNSQPAGMSFPQESYEATIGQIFTKPELTKVTDAVVTYNSSDESVATVDASTGDVILVGAGVTVITATAPQTETYGAGSASYTLTVIDPNAPVQASWTLVTDINQINDNFEYIVASQGEYTTSGKKYKFAYTMVNTEVDTDLLGTADVTITDNTIEEIAENTAIFSISKGSDDLYTFVTAVDGIDKYLTAPKLKKSSLSETPASLDVSISSDGTATISTTVETSAVTLYANPNNGKSQRFAFYASKQKPVQLYYRQKPVSKPVTPDAIVGETTIPNDGTIDLNGAAKTITFEGLAEGVNIWYKFEATPAIAPQAEYTPEAGYSKYDATKGISLTQAGTLTYYAEKDGVAGDTHTISVTGTATGISEIEAAGVATEWFDLSGRRVAAPAKGVYLRKQGAKVTKIAF